MAAIAEPSVLIIWAQADGQQGSNVPSLVSKLATEERELGQWSKFKLKTEIPVELILHYLNGNL